MKIDTELLRKATEKFYKKEEEKLNKADIIHVQSSLAMLKKDEISDLKIISDAEELAKNMKELNFLK